jgi:hypothetical protein
LKALKKQNLTAFEQAMNLYLQKDFTQAKEVCQHILPLNPQHRVANLFLQKAGRLAQAGIDENWHGVEEMEVK